VAAMAIKWAISVTTDASPYAHMLILIIVAENFAIALMEILAKITIWYVTMA
jgi:hypothetical protein